MPVRCNMNKITILLGHPHCMDTRAFLWMGLTETSSDILPPMYRYGPGSMSGPTIRSHMYPVSSPSLVLLIRKHLLIFPPVLLLLFLLHRLYPLAPAPSSRATQALSSPASSVLPRCQDESPHISYVQPDLEDDCAR
jgi:hypothetical protein